MLSAKILAALAIAVGLTPAMHAADTESLKQQITAQDSKLFDAYNNCDLKTLGEMVTDDLEFYHDKTGLATGREPFVESIRNNICGKVKRRLVASSLKVYPLKNYGAIEMGDHQFLQPQGGKLVLTGEAPFILLWKQTPNGWVLARVISYDHKSAQ